MSALGYVGRYFRVTSGSIKLFGLPGFYSRSNWVLGMNLVDGREFYTLVEIEPSSISESIVRQIGLYMSFGKVTCVNAIYLTNRIAVCLFLEGVLTVSHFAQASEEKNKVIVPDVDLAGSLYTLVIWPERLLSDGCVPVDKQEQSLDLL